MLKAAAIQSRVSILLPTDSSIWYGLRIPLSPPTSVENRTDDVTAARTAKSVEAAETMAVTQLPTREQIAKAPTTIAAMAVKKATA